LTKTNDIKLEATVIKREKHEDIGMQRAASSKKDLGIRSSENQREIVAPRLLEALRGFKPKTLKPWF
jgi:hypothetical protein